MLIEDYEIEFSTPECDLESPIFRAALRSFGICSLHS